MASPEHAFNHIPENNSPEKTVSEIIQTREGFEEEFNKISSSFLSFCKGVLFKYYSLKTDFEPEDLVQKTLTKAWKSRSTYKGEGSFYNWLCTIASNLVKDYFKAKKQDMVNLDQGGLETAGQSSFSNYAENSRLKMLSNRIFLKEALDVIKKKRGEIDLKIFEGLMENKTHSEISKETGITQTAVKIRSFRLFKFLKRVLKHKSPL